MDETKKKEIALGKTLSSVHADRLSHNFALKYREYWDEILLSGLPKKKTLRILDFGCGIGELYKRLGSRFEKIYGFDISIDMLKYVPKGKICAADGEALPFKEGAFDIVVARETLHHLPHPEKALKQIKFVLSPAGLLLSSDPCNDSFFLRNLRKVYFKFSKKFQEDHKAFKTEEIRRMHESSGFRVLSTHRVGYIGLPLCDMVDLLPIMKWLPFQLSTADLLVFIDKMFAKIPIINKHNWVTVTKAVKSG